MNILDHLRFLNLKEDFSKTELKRAYRDRCKLLHPDCGGSQESFQRLVDSYEILLVYLKERPAPKDVPKDSESKDLIDCHICKISNLNFNFCYSCNGNGRIRDLNNRHNGIVIAISKECGDCLGLGKIITECKLCGGNLKVSRAEYESYILGFNI